MLTTSRNQNRRVPSATPHRHPNNTPLHYTTAGHFSLPLWDRHTDRSPTCAEILVPVGKHTLLLLIVVGKLETGGKCFCSSQPDTHVSLYGIAAPPPLLNLCHVVVLVPPPTPLAVRSVIQSATPRGALSMF